MTGIARRRELALIHAAKKDLALTDDSYRAILQRLCGVASAAELDARGRQAVLDHFRTLGWNPGRHKAPKRAGARPLDDDPTSKKLRALWIALWNLGEVRNPEEAALAAFVRRQTGVDALQFLSPDRASKAIEALKSWCLRVDFAPDPDEDPIITMRALLRAQWARLAAFDAIDVHGAIGLDSWIHNNTAPRQPTIEHCTLDQLHRLSNELGAWVRRAAARAAKRRAFWERRRRADNGVGA